MEQEHMTPTEGAKSTMSNNQLIIICGIGLVAIMLAGFIGYNVGRDTGAERMHQRMDSDEWKSKKDTKRGEESVKKGHEAMTMDEMTKGLEGLSGDAFDKAFVEMMIVHHQGAVDMARYIPANAKHAELKKLGEAIVTAQTKEIEMMQGWLKSWGYTEGGMMEGGMEGRDHSMMGR